MFCTMLQGLIWKLDDYVYGQCGGNSDSHSDQKLIFGDTRDK